LLLRLVLSSHYSLLWQYVVYADSLAESNKGDNMKVSELFTYLIAAALFLGLMTCFMMELGMHVPGVF